MIQKFKAAGFWAKMGYVGLAITVLLGVGNIGSKVWASFLKVDARYAKQVDLDETNKKLFAMEREFQSSKLLQLDKQLFDMRMRWGPDMSKWTEDQRNLYYEKKADYDKLKKKLEKRR